MILQRLTRLAPAFLLLLVSCALLTACGSAQRFAAPGGVQQTGAATVPEGLWRVTLSSEGLGRLEVLMRFEPAGGGQFEAHSRPGALRDAAGPWRSMLARALGGEAFARGALLHIVGGTAVGASDETVLHGTFLSPVTGRLVFAGRLAGERLSGDIRRSSDDAVWASLEAVPHASTAPLRDYPALAAEIRRAAAAHLYDPLLLESPRWQTFLARIDRTFASARDDADALMTFSAAARNLGLSHLGLIGAVVPPDSAAQPEAASAVQVPPAVSLSFPRSGVALLDVRHFGGTPDPIREAFVRIDSAGAEALIVDLRGNPGGNLSSMAVAAHLLEEETPAGVFLAQRWWRQHREPPRPDQYEGLYVLREYDLPTFFRVLDEEGALVGQVPPAEPRFSGEVFVLIDRRTASAAEPLADVLRRSGRATLVGETTAGAMLSSMWVPLLGNTFRLLLPTADYYNAAGERLEGVGVPPHERTPPAEALETVLQQLSAR